MPGKNIVEQTAQKYKKRNQKQKKGFLKHLLNIAGFNDDMINQAGGGGTTAKGKKKTLADIRREAMGR